MNPVGLTLNAIPPELLELKLFLIVVEETAGEMAGDHAIMDTRATPAINWAVRLSLMVTGFGSALAFSCRRLAFSCLGGPFSRWRPDPH